MKIFLAIFSLIIFWGMVQSNVFAKSVHDDVEIRVEKLKKFYSMQAHVEGGFFAEVYTSPFKENGRATAGSIYFLLVKNDVSHFHKIDCDEIWYYHEGGGLKISVFNAGRFKEIFLGKDIERGQKAMAVIPAGAIFAAENLNRENYTLISCATTPKFNYAGFKLVIQKELKEIYPGVDEKILRLAYEKLPD